MSKVSNINLILLLLSLVTISGFNLFQYRLNKIRALQEVTNVDFVQAINLSFNSGWSFDIKYSSTKLIPNTLYLVSILYKGESSLAKCYVSSEDEYILNCLLSKEGQTQYDLIQINNALTEGANLNWQNLNKIYNIPINTTLKYEDSFSLTYTFISGNNRYYDFRVKLVENVLPENSVVNIDLYLTSSKKKVSLCTYKSLYLYCTFNETRYDTYLIQISSNRDKGSIEWENLENSVTIPITFIVNTYWGADNLTFINNQWVYTLKVRGEVTTYAKNILITLDTKIKNKEGESSLYFTKCLLNEDGSIYFTCTVLGENQAISDLVYITKDIDTKHDISTSFEGVNDLKSKDDIIIRNAELSFLKVYDLIFDDTSRSWSFKIDVDNQDLPDSALVKVDVWQDSNNGNVAISCSYSSYILSCASDKSSIDSTTLIRLMGQKNKGTVNWINTKDKYIPIAMRHTLVFQKALGGFYTDRFHFLIAATNEINTPKYSNIVTNVYVRGLAKTATCTILDKRSLHDRQGYVYCVTDLQRQTTTITWEGLTAENGQISELDTSELITKELKFIDAYDMYFAYNKWIFTINSWDSDTAVGKNRGEIGAYKVDILVNGATKSTAICLNYDGIEQVTNIKFICVCEYANQNKNDLIKISKETKSGSITWKPALTQDQPIALQTTLTIKKGYDLKQESGQKWSFKVDLNSDDHTILPIGSKVIVDMTITPYIANCTAESAVLLSCKSDIIGNTAPKLDFYKSLQSTVNWTNTNKDDYFMISTARLQFISADKLYFQDGKWKFDLSVTPLSSAKVIIDILYGDEASTATCTGGRNNKISCIVDKESQAQDVLIKIKKDKPTGSASTVTWTSGLTKDTDIPLYTQLTYQEAKNLRFENKNWNFDVYITDENIPLNAYIITDIEFLYFYGSKTSYTKRISSIANCYYKGNGLLQCGVVVNRVNYNSYEYNPRLVREKNPSSISTVYQWNNVLSDFISIPLVAPLKYVLNSKIFSEDGNYYTYIELSIDTKVPKDSICTITLTDNDNDYLSECIGQNHTSLKCKIDSGITNKKLYIKKDKMDSATITWSGIIVNQNLFPIELTYVHAYNYNDVANDKTFTVLVQKDSDDNTLVNDLILPIKVHQQVNIKISPTYYYDRINIVPCVYNNQFLYCTWRPIGEHIDVDKDLFSLKLESSGDLIEWKNPGLKDMDLTKSYDLKFKKLLFCEYDEENKYYKYSIELQESAKKGDMVVTELKINDADFIDYGICTVKETKVLECHTPCMANGGDSDKIIILKDKSKGNIYWRISLSGDKQIYPNTIVYVNVDKIYDLKFDTNKWEFKIKYENTMTSSDNKFIDIFIDKTTSSTASCSKIADKNELQCVSDVLTNNQLITLNSDSIDGHIILYNLRHYKIPLTSTLELVSSSGLKYSNNDWSFNLKVKNNDNGFIIPSGTTFSVDILYDTDKSELAFCTEEGTRENNILSLKCIPQHEISQNTLIKLSTAKTDYASITWSPVLTSDNTYIYPDLDLFVEYVTSPQYESNKFSFKMIFNNDNILSGTKANIDIKYNNVDALANCALSGTEAKTFICTPEINEQSQDDDISIVYNKKNGNVNFKNPSENLIFSIKLFYSKSSNLKFNGNKWTFDITLTQSNLQNNQAITIDILINGNSGTAECKLNGNVLNCEVQGNGQEATNILKIVNNKSNTNFKWYDIPDEVDLYIDYKINLKNVYGGNYKEKWGFYLLYEPTETINFNGQNVLLDVIINNLQSTALCQINDTNYLICSPYYNNNNNQISSIKLSGTKDKGTVEFSNTLTEEQKELKPVSFELNYESKEYKFVNNKLEFTLKGKLGGNIEYKLLENSYTELKITEHISDDSEEQKDVHCITNEINKELNSEVIINCETDINNKKSTIKLHINENDYSGYVKIITTLSEIEISNVNDNVSGPGSNDNNSAKRYKNDLIFIFFIFLLL